jgi:hypothetical protein
MSVGTDSKEGRAKESCLFTRIIAVSEAVGVEKTATTLYLANS